MTKFIAIDVETANADMASICQIGIAVFEGGEQVSEHMWLINPEEDFSEINQRVHGIAASDVESKPTLPEVSEELRNLLDGEVMVCHTHFDRVSVARAFAKYDLEPLAVSWLDSSRVVRQVWTEYAQKGYGLANMCKEIGFQFKHHDALEDAKACGHVLLATLAKTEEPFSHWVEFFTPESIKLRAKANASTSAPIKQDGNPDGPLYGEIIVFTGALQLPRREAAAHAAEIGCTVASGVTKKTTLLVVGDQDVSRLAGKEISSKHKKAEDLIAKGTEIRILKESDFIKMVNDAR